MFYAIAFYPILYFYHFYSYIYYTYLEIINFRIYAFVLGEDEKGDKLQRTISQIINVLWKTCFCSCQVLEVFFSFNSSDIVYRITQ